jgi:hypothetical protein
VKQEDTKVPTQSIDLIARLSTTQSIDFEVTRIPGLLFLTGIPILQVTDEQGLAASHLSHSNLSGHGASFQRSTAGTWLIVLLNAATHKDPFVGLLEPHLTYARECVIHHTSGMSIQARLIYPKDLWLFWEYTMSLLGVISMTPVLYIPRQDYQWELSYCGSLRLAPTLF